MLSYLVQYAVFILHSFADLPCVPIFTSTRYYNDNYFYNVGIYLVVVLIQIMNEGRYRNGIHTNNNDGNSGRGDSY